MKFHHGLVSKAKRLFVPYSPASANAKKNTNGEFAVGNKQVDSGISYIGSPDFGHKDEAFFDTMAWFDSDCEDDYFSVNGDFTPSRGSTPTYQITSQKTPLNKSFFGDTIPDTKSEPSPTDGKKKLAELLQESFQVEQDEHKQEAENAIEETKGWVKNFKPVNDPSTLKSFWRTPLSGANSSSRVSTPNSEMKYRKERVRRNPQCCLPSFTHSHSYNERKRPVTPER